MQSEQELDAWHEKQDPWNYESTPDDQIRKSMLLNELPARQYDRVLDIGCGQGYVTRDLPGRSVMGVDISGEAIDKAQAVANERVSFLRASLFELPKKVSGPFDLIVITGVLYPQYIGNAATLVYGIADDLLASDGVLASVHIDARYRARFPYLMLKELFYPYREYTHRLELYIK